MSDHDPITVIIIDDHVMVAETVAAALNATDDIVVQTIAASGSDGLRLVAEHQPNVCLLDQSLPDGTGTDLLPDLLAASPLTRILLVTGTDSEEVLRQALAGGGAGFVAKGQRTSTLIDAVRRASEGEIVLTSEDLRRLLPRPTQLRLGDDLSPREREVLSLLAEGRTTREIGEHLFISPATVRNHIQSILSKLGAHSKLQAVTIAIREGIVNSR